MSNQHPKEVNTFMKNYNGPRQRVAPLEIAEFENRYGEKKVVHVTRSGLRVKNNRSTVALELNRKISVIVGQKIKARRLELGLSLEEACIRSGLSSTTPKSRMWEIENCQAQQGLKLGTLYALSIGLETSPEELLPSLDEVLEKSNVTKIEQKTVIVK
jgi:hypothetical protein